MTPRIVLLHDGASPASRPGTGRFVKMPLFARGLPRGGAIATGFLLLTFLAGCSTVSSATSPVSPAAPAAPASRFGHVHGVGFDETTDAVYIATHTGLYTVSGSLNSPKDSGSLGGPIAGLRQDNMGFVIDGERMYASGHPDPTVSSDANLGLISSTDQGKSWKAISLKGTTDFHDLEISHAGQGAATIYGFDSADAVVRVSRDGGSTWTSGSALAMRDMAADRALPGTIYATTSDGLKVSRDYAASFELSPGAPALYLIAAAGSTAEPQLVGIDAAGVVWKKSDNTPWRATGAVTGTADALALTVWAISTLLVADQRGIVTSSDYGATWRVLVTN